MQVVESPRPRLARTVPDVRKFVAEHRAQGHTIGLVPTMGALHAGHLSLVQTAQDHDDVVVVSIFVNPLQFAPSEDLASYPRDLNADLDLLGAAGVDVVFHPDPATFTPAHALTRVHVAALTDGLEAATRPTHFDGVTTIVTKLFNSVVPDRAYLGQKDFQQQAIIRQMVDDLNMDVHVIACPLIREPDGLAMSSRNTYLSDPQRAQALALSRSLTDLIHRWDGDATGNRAWLQTRLGDASGIELDYAEIIDPVTLTPLKGRHTGQAQAVVAAYVGDTRLIDTVSLPPQQEGRHDAAGG